MPEPPVPAQITPELRQKLERLGDILMPYAARIRAKRYPERSSVAQFVHYTSAEAALNIIEKKQMWMRNALCMADYREIDHGYSILLAANPRLVELSAAVEACTPQAAAGAFTVFNQNWQQIRSNTYITSLSEHEPSENFHGRLSMWRAFGTGGAPRVGLVIGVPWLGLAGEALKLAFSPVAYMDQAGVEEEIAAVIRNVRENREFICGCEPQFVGAMVFTMLLSAVTCLKHPGFHEEREWRAIHGAGPLIAPDYMKLSTQCINGVPQQVYRIPLDANACPPAADLDLSRILQRVIIGPTQYPLPIAMAFVDALTRAEVPDPGAKVFVSGIPIRT